MDIYVHYLSFNRLQAFNYKPMTKNRRYVISTYYTPALLCTVTLLRTDLPVGNVRPVFLCCVRCYRKAY